MRTSATNITELSENEIFVFGSNLSGIHGGGAARIALQWGAQMGNGVGIQGSTYAIPTKSEGITRSLTVEEIAPYVDGFLVFAFNHPELNFLVTEVGCGLAGHTIESIAPLFEKFVDLENVWLPKEFLYEIKKLSK